MAKKRSKKDRIKAKAHRLISKEPEVLQKEVAKSDYLQEIFAYDPKLIVKDLRKTFLVVLFILLVLLTISLIYT